MKQAYVNPNRVGPSTRPQPYSDVDIEGTAADVGEDIPDEPFYDYQVHPQPVYLVDETPQPFTVRSTFSSFTVTPTPTRVVANRYSVDRTVKIINVGKSDVYVTSSDNDKLAATRYKLLADVQDYLQTNTTQQVYVYCDDSAESEVSIQEEWKEVT